ncbi:hypothetical protein EBS57_10740 [bacterium]|nr:hypothetical protein [bacterium]
MRDGLRKFSILVGLVVWIGAAQKPPVLIRVHLQAPEGAKGQVSVPVTLFQPNETIAIQNLPEVTEKEIRRISTRTDGTILVEFNDFGKTKLEGGVCAPDRHRDHKWGDPVATGLCDAGGDRPDEWGHQQGEGAEVKGCAQVVVNLAVRNLFPMHR